MLTMGSFYRVDIENFVALFPVLRQTFDAPGRKYGLTFTIPSSYWYLRWFDVPDLLESADSVNLMSTKPPPSPHFHSS